MSSFIFYVQCYIGVVYASSFEWALLEQRKFGSDAKSAHVFSGSDPLPKSASLSLYMYRD